MQVYVRDVESSVVRPDKELKGFAKVHLEPGEAQTVSIALDRRAFAVWDVAAQDWLVEAGTYEIVVARSSVEVVATTAHEVASDDRVTPVPGPASFVATDAEFARLLGGPVPEVPPVRPFHRNSTLEELQATWVGRRIGDAVLRQALREAAHEFPDPDPATRRMIRSAVTEGPIRGLVLMSGGRFPFPLADAVVAVANGDRRALGEVLAELVRRR
ncbi:MAG: fibronectin type III-like domain-contianing protein [Acidimicrobiales bacterium]|nr:fibronectin type III-like domain-contianing protein [Acidimicrobiales bacterium]